VSTRLLVPYLALLLVAVAPAQASSGIQLVGGCDTPGEAFSVAVSGDYAYVADGYAGLRVISVVDPAHPVEVGSFDSPGWAHGVAVSGNYAYVADYDSGLRVISVADPAHAVEVGHFDTPGLACGVAVNGDRAYVANYTAGLRIISVADPAHPVEVGHYNTQDLAWGIVARGDTAHVASVDQGYTAVSAIDPANPIVVGGFFDFFSYPLGGVAVSGNYAYITHDSLGLVVMSITPSQMVGHCGAYIRAGGVAAGYGYVYVAADEDGLQAISVSDPAHPVVVGSYDVPNWWANGVTVASGYVYVAYGMAGLQIFQALGGIAEETMSDERRTMNVGPTIVRGVLFLPSSLLTASSSLLSIDGHKVLNLKPGANDVSHLAPGVYFMRSAVGGERSAVTKVIVSR
jgi:hypothetical protein